MSRFDNEVRVSWSVLDRLLDFDPNLSQDAPKSQSASLVELKQAVRRDLEWLLNTRCHLNNEDGGLEEAPKSVAFYGLPDFTSVSAKSSGERDRMIRSIEAALAVFEPRFSGIKVSLEPISNIDRTLKFKIEATLEIEPTPEPVVFDTVLQLGSGNFSVSG